MGIKPINTESMAYALRLARSQEIEGCFARPILVDWGDGVLKIENRDIGSDLRSLRESIWSGCRREQLPLRVGCAIRLAIFCVSFKHALQYAGTRNVPIVEGSALLRDCHGLQERWLAIAASAEPCNHILLVGVFQLAARVFILSIGAENFQIGRCRRASSRPTSLPTPRGSRRVTPSPPAAEAFAKRSGRSPA